MCSSHIHKIDENGSGLSEEEENQTYNSVQLLGQPIGIYQRLVSSAGPSDQQEEITASAIPRNCVLGFDNFNYHNASVTAQGESSLDSAGGQAITHQVKSVNTETSRLCGHENSRKTGNPSSTTVSSPLSSSDKQSGTFSILYRGSETVLPSGGKNICGSLTGVGVVDAGDAESQWSSITDGHTQLGDRIRCLSPDWGVTLKVQGLRTGGQWSASEQEMPGATGSITGNSDFCQGGEEH